MKQIRPEREARLTPTGKRIRGTTRYRTIVAFLKAGKRKDEILAMYRDALQRADEITPIDQTCELSDIKEIIAVAIEDQRPKPHSRSPIQIRRRA